MSGLVESAAAILSSSEGRLKVVARNVANISTPGYKRAVAFSRLLDSGASNARKLPGVDSVPDIAQAKLTNTGNPLDIAISGDGFFRLRAGEAIIASRQGQFSIGESGAVVTPQGYVLQQQGGGDLLLGEANVKILEDGTVIEDGRPIARIGLVHPGEDATLRAFGESSFVIDGDASEPSGAILRQGMVENSNVSIGDEMVAMTAAVRQSEAGARLIQVYDDLIGRAITSFGQSR